MSYNITLPSNVCMDMFRNTPSDYITQLAQHLQLDGQWVVGLTEVHIPCTWFNITKSNNLFSIVTASFDDAKTVTAIDHAQCRIPEGHYITVDDILTHINICILKRTLKQDIKFHYDHDANRVSIKFLHRHITFHFDENSTLAETLGFKDVDFISRNMAAPDEFKDTITARYPPDMTGSVNGVYIYTDIVEHQYVGDKMAPLLRVVPVDKTKGKYIYHVFQHPYYIPVTRQRIDAIELHLRTDFGESLVFESGKTLVKLHFKRVTP